YPGAAACSHASQGFGLSRRMFCVHHQPIEPGSPEDVRNRRVGQSDLHTETDLLGPKLSLKLSRFFEFSNHPCRPDTGITLADHSSKRLSQNLQKCPMATGRDFKPRKAMLSSHSAPS